MSLKKLTKQLEEKNEQKIVKKQKNTNCLDKRINKKRL